MSIITDKQLETLLLYGSKRSVDILFDSYEESAHSKEQRKLALRSVLEIHTACLLIEFGVILEKQMCSFFEYRNQKMENSVSSILNNIGMN